MNESKTRCATCGTSILTRTAERNAGLCAPCFGKARSTIPETFELSQDLLQRIASTDVDPKYFRQVAWRNGPDSVARLLDQLEATTAECRRWSPALRAFAAECRRTVPTPDVETLAGSELAQYHLLRDEMSQFATSKDGLVTLTPRPDRVAVLSTNRVGLAAAEELFRGSGAVVLEVSEWSRWFAETYRAHGNELWWYAFAWWRIDVGLDDKDAEPIRRREPASSADSYWIVESGVQWGPLAGGSRQELWRWNGAQAEFVETYSDTTF